MTLPFQFPLRTPMIPRTLVVTGLPDGPHLIPHAALPIFLLSQGTKRHDDLPVLEKGRCLKMHETAPFDFGDYFFSYFLGSSFFCSQFLPSTNRATMKLTT